MLSHQLAPKRSQRLLCAWPGQHEIKAAEVRGMEVGIVEKGRKKVGESRQENARVARGSPREYMGDGGVRSYKKIESESESGQRRTVDPSTSTTSRQVQARCQVPGARRRLKKEGWKRAH